MSATSLQRKLQPLSTFYDQECEKMAKTASRACDNHVPVGFHLWICIHESSNSTSRTEWI